MPWANEERGRRYKKVWHTEEPGRYRVAATLNVLHYESVIDSGNFDTEIDLRHQRYTGPKLDGWRIINNGWHFAYQGFAPTQQQQPLGTIGFGGRKGQHWFNMRPHRIGYLHWNTRAFTAIGGPPTFGTPTRQDKAKTIGVNDGDPNTWTINAAFSVNLGSLWTFGSGTVDWNIKASGNLLKQDFIVNQAARDWIANNAPPTTPAPQTWFGVVYKVDFSDIPRLSLGGVLRNKNGDDFEVGEDLELQDATGKRLASFMEGDIRVLRMGGRVAIRKRIYFDGTDWWFFIGCNVRDMERNLLPGDLVIDPPITEEDIPSTNYDASQAGTSMTRNGSIIYVGRASNYYHSGWVFDTVPIAQAETVNSATLEPTQAAATQNTANFTVYGFDEDNTGSFSNSPSNLTNRAITSASTTLSTTSLPGDNNRASWDVQAQVQEIVDRSGWTSNNTMGFRASGDSTYLYNGFDDFSGSQADDANFNADVGGGGGPTIFNLKSTGIGL